ncbi:unnamed protein product, partial [Mesorhabditis spiculigera]
MKVQIAANRRLAEKMSPLKKLQEIQKKIKKQPARRKFSLVHGLRKEMPKPLRHQDGWSRPSTPMPSNLWEQYEMMETEYQHQEAMKHVPDSSRILLYQFQAERIFPIFADGGINSKKNTSLCAQQLARLGEESITFILNGLDADNDYQRKVVAVALDASAKPGAGIFRGHFHFFGVYHQCIDIKFKDDKGAFQGDYFRLYLDLAFRDYKGNGSCGSIKWGLDLCLPATCRSHEVEGYLHDILPRLINSSNLIKADPVCGVTWINDSQKPVPAGGYIVGVTMLAIFALCFISGIYDYSYGEEAKKLPISKALWFKIFMAFSFYRNVSEIFSTAGSNKAGQIGPIHCIRFFSMSWVIMGHILAMSVALGSNPQDVIDVTHDLATQFLTNSYFAVDSFFFISGLLLAFIWFKDFKKNKRRAMSPLAWTMFYVHRLLRLSPPYYFVILFYTFVLPPWLQSSPLLLPLQAREDNCQKNWWVNLLYLTNFVHYREQCYLVSWYLATDLQIYIFAPLILVPFAINKFLGMAVSGGIFILSTGINIASVLHYHYPLTDYTVGIIQDPRMTNQDYNMVMYNAPWIRCQIYIQGMWVGYFLQMYTGKLKLNRFVKQIGNIVLFLISLGLMLIAVMVVKDWVKNEDWPVGWRAIYSAFSRPAWGFGLSWLIIASYYGYGGFINRFMSWNIWIPLGRLTYCAYLIHICVVMFFLGNHKTDLIWSNFFNSFTEYCVPCIVLTYLIAILWSAAFEVSLGKVEMILIGGLRGRAPPKPEGPAAEAGNVVKIEKEEGPVTAVGNGATVTPADNTNGISTDKRWE